MISRFEAFKSCGDRHGETALSLHGVEAAELWRVGSEYGAAQNWARYLSDMPANKMTPVDFAQVIRILGALSARTGIKEVYSFLYHDYE